MHGYATIRAIVCSPMWPIAFGCYNSMNLPIFIYIYSMYYIELYRCMSVCRCPFPKVTWHPSSEAPVAIGMTWPTALAMHPGMLQQELEANIGPHCNALQWYEKFTMMQVTITFCTLCGSLWFFIDFDGFDKILRGWWLLCIRCTYAHISFLTNSTRQISWAPSWLQHVQAFITDMRPSNFWQWDIAVVLKFLSSTYIFNVAM